METQSTQLEQPSRVTRDVIIAPEPLAGFHTNMARLSIDAGRLNKINSVYLRREKGVVADGCPYVANGQSWLACRLPSSHTLGISARRVVLSPDMAKKN
jgi:hypothetical protein